LTFKFKGNSFPATWDCSMYWRALSWALISINMAPSRSTTLAFSPSGLLFRWSSRMEIECSTWPHFW
jgi:hypothetical protein